jgi:hypothetical protein
MTFHALFGVCVKLAMSVYCSQYKFVLLTYDGLGPHPFHLPSPSLLSSHLTQVTYNHVCWQHAITLSCTLISYHGPDFNLKVSVSSFEFLFSYFVARLFFFYIGGWFL